jgi:hypothetical protein
LRNIRNRRQYWDTIVEIIDPAAGTVLASVRVDGVLEFFTPEGYAVEYVEDASGVPSLVVWSVRAPDAR